MQIPKEIDVKIFDALQDEFLAVERTFETHAEDPDSGRHVEYVMPDIYDALQPFLKENAELKAEVAELQEVIRRLRMRNTYMRTEVDLITAGVIMQRYSEVKP